MPEIPVGRITFSLSGHKFEMSAPDLKVMLSPQMIHATAKQEGAADENAACAELVRAAAQEIFRPIREAFTADPKYIHKQDGGSFIRWGLVERDVIAAIHALAERIEARGKP